jgi:anti-anti-sigma factor
MSLTLESRRCGPVCVIKCAGRLFVGTELQQLETALQRVALEFNKIVLNVGDVSRVDSTGMGLLVRYLVHTRNKRGDLRLAVLPDFFAVLLQLTKLTTILRTFPSEEEAIVSFLKDPSATTEDNANSGPKVLFLDQSADLGVFVRTLLSNHGYEVLTTCRVHDAKILLRVGKVDLIVLGPDNSQLTPESIISSLKSIAPNVSTFLLQKGFKHLEAAEAGSNLLTLIQGRSPA